MEEKKTVFNYISRLFATYGIMVTIFIILALIVGEYTQDLSSLFRLGGKGLSLATLAQLLGLALVITVAQTVFLSDTVIKKMSLVLRNILFFVTILAAIIITVIVFGWFPIGNIFAWIGFIVSFLISMGISVGITKAKESAENSKMEEALKKYNSNTQ